MEIDFLACEKMADAHECIVNRDTREDCMWLSTPDGSDMNAPVKRVRQAVKGQMKDGRKVEESFRGPTTLHHTEQVEPTKIIR